MIVIREDVLRSQLGPSYDRVPSTLARRHAEMLTEVVPADAVRVAADPLGNDRCQVAVCANDAPGILSIIAGLFAAHGVGIESAAIHTVRIDAPVTHSSPRRWRPFGRSQSKTRPVRRILDLFEVGLPRTAAGFSWRVFSDELSVLLAIRNDKGARAVREALLPRICQTLARTALPCGITPVQVEIDNESNPTATVIEVSTVDAFGFLFEFTSGLELLKVSVQSAEIRTTPEGVQDTFFVTDLRGEKITNVDRIHEIRFGASLIQQFSQLLPLAPNPALAIQQFGEFTGELFSRPHWTRDFTALESWDVLKTLAELLGVSQFLWQDFLRIQHENLFPILSNLPCLDRGASRDELCKELEQRLSLAVDVPEQVRELNAFKDREMFRIDLRNITGRTDVDAFGEELATLAECVLDQSGSLTERLMRQRFGMPRLDNGQPCHWCGCVLGKLGGREIGYAADIELIFVYEGHGKSDGTHSLDNTQYFEQFVADFLRTPKVARGGIFEIDLRLRPYGRSGNLACTLDIFERYFSMDGHAEPYMRLALVKLRPCFGNAELGTRVQRARDAFVYSRQAVEWENIRRLRAMQQEQLVPAGRFSAKHSAGGLVDLEYFIQAHQIQAGSRNAEVREPSTRIAIDRLASAGVFEPLFAAQLQRSYRFWRLMIDALRCVRGNSQDLTIPSEGSSEYAYLARRLRFASSAALAAELDQHIAFCRELFDQRTTDSQAVVR